MFVTYIQTYKHTNIQTYKHTYIQTLWLLESLDLLDRETKNEFLLDANQCGFQFPVDVCVKNEILLDANQCNFEFPLKVCTANTQLFSRTQCRSHVSGPEMSKL